MSFAMNPTQIKHREYLGLGALIAGVLTLFAGVVCLLMSMALGLALISLGTAVAAAGLFVLTKIPDVLGQPEQLW